MKESEKIGVEGVIEVITNIGEEEQVYIINKIVNLNYGYLIVEKPAMHAMLVKFYGLLLRKEALLLCMIDKIVQQKNQK